MLIDVRSKEEYESFHLDDAINIPLDQINDDSVKDISKDEEVILYCASGGRSAMAVEIFKELGYTKVNHIEGGIM